MQDAKIISVALNGLDNILKAGENHNVRPNPYAVAIEECYGESFNLIIIIVGHIIHRCRSLLILRSGQNRVLAVASKYRNLPESV